MGTPLLDAITAVGTDSTPGDLIARLLRLHEDSGTTADDASANSVDGTYFNAPTLDQAALSLDDGASSVDFDGVDQYVAASGNTGANVQYPFTLVALVQTSQTPSGRTQIVCWGRASSTNDNHAIGINTSGQAIAQSTNGTVHGVAVSASPINDGERHLLVAVFESATSRKIYVDNLAAVENTTSVSSSTFGTRSFNVGRAVNGAGSADIWFSASRYFDGTAEFATMLNKAASDAEVLTLWAAINPWVGLFTESVSVADEAGGNPGNTAQLFDSATVTHPDDDNLTGSLVIDDPSVADIDGSLPSGWTDAGGGTYTCTSRTPGQMEQDIQALSIAGASIGSTTATLTLTDEGSDTSAVVVSIDCVDTDFSITVTPGGEVDFGDVASGQLQTLTIEIENTGNDDLTFDDDASAITGTNAAQFTKSSGWTGSSAVVITPGNSVTRAITFNFAQAALTPGEYTATLTIETDDPNNPSYELDLVANALAPDSGGGSGGVAVAVARMKLHMGMGLAAASIMR